MRKLGFIVAVLILSLVVEVSAQVDTAWVRLFTGTGRGEDQARAIATDPTGGVYIAGAIDNWPIGGFDFTLVKYDAAGAVAWSYVRDGNPQLEDACTDVALDSDGNVIVTGWVTNLSTGADFFTAKLTPAGDTLWERAYSADSANGSDRAQALAIDFEGNILVTGRSWGGSTWDDLLTLKYDPEGQLLWHERYYDPAEDYEFATDVEVDSQGDVIVGGGSSVKHAVVKYSRQGVALWARWLPYGRLGNVEIDEYGDIVLIGGAYTTKLDASGHELWRKSIPGRAPHDLVIGENGDVFVTGRISSSSSNYIQAAKYTNDGALAWEFIYYPPWSQAEGQPGAIALDPQGHVLITGMTNDLTRPDCITLKLDSNGVLIWSDFIHLPNSNTSGFGITYGYSLSVDIDGSVYVAGRHSLRNDGAMMLAKYEVQRTVQVDILPGSCPNTINTGGTDLNYPGIRPGAAAANRPTVPVAILGTKTFDVSRVDPSTIQVAGLSPLSHRHLDVSRPVDPREAECECTTAGADGYTDIVLYFDQAQFVAALGPINDGELRTLALTGKTKTGVPLSGSDCVTIKTGPIRISPLASAGEKLETGFAVYPNPFNAAAVASFVLATDSDVRVDVYDVLGRHVATLVDDLMPAGEHQVSWDAAGWASGVYFARLATSVGVMTRKMVLVR